MSAVFNTLAVIESANLSPTGPVTINPSVTGAMDNVVVGATTPKAGTFTTFASSGQITSTVTTGTAPFVVASTTVVANLNASALGGATFAAPGAIGGGTPGAGTFTTLAATGAGSILTGTAIPAGGTAGSGYKVSSATNFGVFFGSGPPTLAAAKGSLYLRSDGTGVADRAYINTDGSTTWTALATAG